MAEANLKIKSSFQNLPSVDKILQIPEIKILIDSRGRKLVLFAVRKVLNHYRTEISKGSGSPELQEIHDKIKSSLKSISEKSLKKVLNATGVILHTNLGRAPFGEQLISDSFEVLKGYNNLEFNLQTGMRGNRNDHAVEVIKYLTGAEDAIIVNNNAAAVLLLLRVFARNKEVLVSRGELIEIGGSFRIPEIMAASDCRMVEIGTTNKTNIEDYIKAINNNTALIFKAHKSNYQIKGFTEEVEVGELVSLSKKHKIPFVYDLGSGLLLKSDNKVLKYEPSVEEAIKKGIDLICFSGDKLLGGPQAGIIAGKKKLVARLKKEPMLRALRVCKTTIALLETSFSYFLDENKLLNNNFVHSVFNRKQEEIKRIAQIFSNILEAHKIDNEIVSSYGQAGGGTIPEEQIPSYAVRLLIPGNSKQRSDMAEKIHYSLLQHKHPVLSVLKKGYIYFDMLTVFESDINELSDTVTHVVLKEK